MSSTSQIGSAQMSGSMALKSHGAPRGRPPEPTPEMRAQFESKFESAAQELGIDTDAFKDLREKIDEAVNNVRMNGATQGNTKSAIDDAVNGVLKENGIDPAEFKSQMASIFEKMGMPKPGQGGFGADGSSTQGSSSLSLLSNLPTGSFVDATA